MSWSRTFDEPIPLPDGRMLKTLGDAGHHITRLPKSMQSLPAWQLAAEMLLNAAKRGGIAMLAEIAMRRALNGGKPTPEAPADALRRQEAERKRQRNEKQKPRWWALWGAPTARPVID